MSRNRIGSLAAAPFALAMVVAGGAFAQPPVSPSAAPQAEAEAYSYNPLGRRDPFLSLLARGSEPRPTGRRGDGLAGLMVGELVVRGIVQSRGGFVAMVQAPDSKTYLVHPNDRLLDGTVRAITAQALIIAQEVNDPLSLVKQREVRKPLRPLDEGK